MNINLSKKTLKLVLSMEPEFMDNFNNLLHLGDLKKDNKQSEDIYKKLKVKTDKYRDSFPEDGMRVLYNLIKDMDKEFNK